MQLIQTPAVLALPSVGPLLGAAYDRGVTTLIRSWPVALILLIIGSVLVSIPGLAQVNFANLLLIVWNFYAMANAIRVVFDQDYRMTNATAGAMFATNLLTGVTFAFLNIIAIVAVARASLHDLTWVFAIPGAIISIWIYVRWACAPVLAARGTSAIKALDESWQFTSIAFWPTLVFPVANFVVGYVIGIVIGTAARLVPLAHAPGFVAAVVPIAETSLLLVGTMYATQASQLAICMWLKALRAVRPDEIAPVVDPADPVLDTP